MKKRQHMMHIRPSRHATYQHGGVSLTQDVTPFRTTFKYQHKPFVDSIDGFLTYQKSFTAAIINFALGCSADELKTE